MRSACGVRAEVWSRVPEDPSTSLAILGTAMAARSAALDLARLAFDAATVSIAGSRLPLARHFFDHARCPCSTLDEVAWVVEGVLFVALPPAFGTSAPLSCWRKRVNKSSHVTVNVDGVVFILERCCCCGTAWRVAAAAAAAAADKVRRVGNHTCRDATVLPHDIKVTFNGLGSF